MKEKKYFLGLVDRNGTGQKNCPAYITWELEDRDGKLRFSMSAEVWRADKRDIYMGGQCVDAVAAMFPNDSKAARMAEIWKRWHLNDMRPACPHQTGPEWDTSKEIEVTRYTWTTKYHEERKRAAAGAMSAEEYAIFQPITKRVETVTLRLCRVAWETPEVAELLAAGWIKEEKREKKTAGWVYPAEHPEGLLTKPCGVCGYKYGSAWLYEPIPEDVLAEIRSW